jgi:putative glycosyltransferase (TIGR04372 family)
MSRKIKIFRSFKSTRNSPLVIDRSGLIERSPSKLIFSKNELATGQKFLKSCRVFDEKFVTLHIRDSAYLTHLYGRIDPKHDYRNSNINTYILAAENLAEMGYTVFRMGAIVKEPFKSRHPRVIDYATNGMRTEFLDIFLGAKCQFSISTGSGWDSVPTIFSRPLMFINQLPIFAPSIVTLPIISYPKTLIDSETGNRPSLSELISRNLANRFNSYAYKNLGVDIKDLSSDEIAEAVIEMADRVNGKFKETQEQQQLQAKLREILSTHPSLQPSPNYFPIRGIFASTFLKNNPHFVL